MKHYRLTLTKFDDVQVQALRSEKELKEILFYPHISFSLSNFLLQSSFEFVYIHTTQTFFFDSFGTYNIVNFIKVNENALQS
jgi:hypothetical protein